MDLIVIGVVLVFATVVVKEPAQVKLPSGEVTAVAGSGVPTTVTVEVVVVVVVEVSSAEVVVSSPQAAVKSDRTGIAHARRRRDRGFTCFSSPE
jgi:hypothetical protein